MPKLVIRPGTPQAQEFELKPGKNYVGRAFANDLKLEDPSVSGSHAMIEVSGNLVTITDLGSTNGTRINQLPATGNPLQSGQMLRLGSVELLFLADASAHSSPPAAAPPLATPAAKIATEFFIREPSHIGAAPAAPPPPPPPAAPSVELRIPGVSPAATVPSPPASAPILSVDRPTIPSALPVPIAPAVPAPDPIPVVAETRAPAPVAPAPMQIPSVDRPTIPSLAPAPIAPVAPAPAPVLVVAEIRAPVPIPTPVAPVPVPIPAVAEIKAPAPVAAPVITIISTAPASHSGTEPKVSGMIATPRPAPAPSIENPGGPEIVHRSPAAPAPVPIMTFRPAPVSAPREPMISSAAELLPPVAVATAPARVEPPAAPTPMAAAKILAALQPATATAMAPMPPASSPALAEPPPGITACKFHQNTAGQWLCQKCNLLFCSLCVGTRPTTNGVGYFCRTCGTQCVAVKVKVMAKKEKKLTAYSDATILLRVAGFGAIASLVCGGLWLLFAWLVGFPIPGIFMVASGAACGYAIKLASQDRPGALYTFSSILSYLVAVAIGEVGCLLMVHMLGLGIATYVGFVGGIFLAWKIGGGDF